MAFPSRFGGWDEAGSGLNGGVLGLKIRGIIESWLSSPYDKRAAVSGMMKYPKITFVCVLELSNFLDRVIWKND